MATYRASAAGGGSGGTGNRTVAISAVAGDHLTCFVQWSGNSAANPTCTDDQSGTYDLITTALCNSSADIQAAFVRRKQVLTTATITITPVVGSGNNTSGEVFAVAVSGMTRMGTNSVRQNARQQNQTSGVPTPVFGASALTGNLTIVTTGASNGTAGALAVPESSPGVWTERQDAGQTAGVSNLELATRDSGFTGTTTTYTSTTSTLWNSIFVELDTTVPDFVYFDKEQWPIPEGHKVGSKGQPTNELKTWTQNVELNLIGKDRFFGADGDGPTYDWPNPRYKQIPVELLTWDLNLLQSTLAPTGAVSYDILRSPLYIKLEPPGYPIGLRSWTQGDAPLLRGAAAQDPFFMDDWPNPRGPRPLPQQWDSSNTTNFRTPVYDVLRSALYTPRWSLRVFTQDYYQNLLLSTLGVVQTPFTQDDWPVPRGRVPAIDLRTWIDQLNVLAGTDTFFGLAGHPPFDWPVPKGAQPGIGLKTWIQELLPTLLSQDQFFGLAGHPNFDWPNPRGPVPVVDLKTWTETTLYLIGSDTFFGLAGHPTFDWPNPRGSVGAIDLRTWLERYKLELIGQDQLPELNVQWPVPRGPVSFDLRGWLDRTRTQLIGQDQLPELNIQWPNPRGPQHPLQWQVGSLNELLLTFVAPLPFALTDWPVPLSEIPDLQLRTWFNAVRLQLIGKDQFFGLAGHPNFSWPNPTGEPPLVPPLLMPVNPNLLPPPPISPDQLRQIIRFAPIAFGGKTHWGR